MQAIVSLLFTHSIVDSSNVPPGFLGKEELNTVTWHVLRECLCKSGPVDFA